VQCNLKYKREGTYTWSIRLALMPKRKEKAQIATASQNGYENDGRWAWRADPKSDMDLTRIRSRSSGAPFCNALAREGTEGLLACGICFLSGASVGSKAGARFPFSRLVAAKVVREAGIVHPASGARLPTEPSHLAQFQVGLYRRKVSCQLTSIESLLSETRYHLTKNALSSPPTKG